MTKPRLILGTLVLAIVILVTKAFFETKAYEEAYGRLSRGSTKAQVLRDFGKPAYDRRWCLSPLWDEEPVQPGTTPCVETFWYNSHMSIEQWVVGFDKNGRVVTKGYLQSP